VLAVRFNSFGWMKFGKAPNPEAQGGDTPAEGTVAGAANKMTNNGRGESPRSAMSSEHPKEDPKKTGMSTPIEGQKNLNLHL